MNIKAKEKQNIHIGLLDDNNRSTITAKLMKQKINHIKLTLLDLQSVLEIRINDLSGGRCQEGIAPSQPEGGIYVKLYHNTLDQFSSRAII